MNIAGLFSSLSGSDVTDGVTRLIQDAVEFVPNRRLDQRIPFRTAALLKAPGDFAWTPVYTRDISQTGMGFTHSMPIDPGDVTVMFQTPAGERISFAAQVLWCRQQPDNTFLSGARFESAQIHDCDG